MNDKIGYWVMTFMHVNGRGGRYGDPDARAKRYPSMPKAQWRRLAAICFAVGAAIAAVLIGNDGGRTIAGAVFGGLVAIAVGMYVIESIWLRGRSPVIGTAPTPDTTPDTTATSDRTSVRR